MSAGPPARTRRPRPYSLGRGLLHAPSTYHADADILILGGAQQQARLEALFDLDAHVEIEAIWGVYQRMVAAYRHPDRTQGRRIMEALIASLAAGVPAVLVELRTLGRTLKKRSADVLAYFDRLGTSNGPTEAINGRLEHLRGSALGFRNLTNYIARSLLEAGGEDPTYIVDCEEPVSRPCASRSGSSRICKCRCTVLALTPTCRPTLASDRPDWYNLIISSIIVSEGERLRNSTPRRFSC